jgi:hypothetical protein
MIIGGVGDISPAPLCCPHERRGAPIKFFCFPLSTDRWTRPRRGVAIVAHTEGDFRQRRTHMRKSISSIVALASLASVMLLYPVGPAAAKKTACQQKATACERRCAARNSDSTWMNCVYRTCTKQYGTCG